MPHKSLSGLTNVGALAEGDMLYVVRGGNSRRATLGNLGSIDGLAVTDGNIIVGDGSNWVAESGATARTSLGLGTGDSPTFTGLTVSGTISVGTNLVPDLADGAGVGTALLPISDAFLASGAVIDFGNNNARLTHSSGLLNITGAQLRLTNTMPAFAFAESDATANEGKWQQVATADTFLLGTINDAENSFDTVFTVTRTGIVPDQISFGCNVNAESGFVYRVNGTKVVGTQQSAIANLAWTYTANDPATVPNSAVTFADGTALVAATAYEAFDEIEAKINAILAALRTHGLIAT